MPKIQLFGIIVMMTLTFIIICHSFIYSFIVCATVDSIHQIPHCIIVLHHPKPKRNTVKWYHCHISQRADYYYYFYCNNSLIIPNGKRQTTTNARESHTLIIMNYGIGLALSEQNT